MNTDITLYLSGNDCFSNMINDVGTVNSRVISIGNRISQGSLSPGNDPRGASRVDLVIPQLWEYHDGISNLSDDLNSVAGGSGQFQTMNMPLYVKHGVEFASNPESTLPVLGVGSASTSGNTKPGLRVGRIDGLTGIFDYYYDQYRLASTFAPDPLITVPDGGTGWYNFVGNQTGFVQYEFDAAVNDTRVPTSTSSATVSPAASASGTSYILTNASPTFNLPASAGCTVGKTWFRVQATGGNLSVSPNGSDVIGGAQWNDTTKTFAGYFANSAIVNYILRYQTVEFRYVASQTWQLCGGFIFKT